MYDFWRIHDLASRNGRVGLYPRYVSEEHYGISLPWSIGFAGVGLIARRMGHVWRAGGDDVTHDCTMAANEAGVNFFDTVEAYAAGKSEVSMGTSSNGLIGNERTDCNQDTV